MTSSASGVLRGLLLVLLLAWLLPATAVELRTFKSPEEEARFRALVAELRCLVCQNQALSDSDAELAQDLRREVHDMIDAGKTDAEIIDFLVARYGDFVLYRPPVRPYTIALWVGPFVLAAVGLWMLFAHLRGRQRRAAEESAELDESQRRQVAELLARHRGERS